MLMVFAALHAAPAWPDAEPLAIVVATDRAVESIDAEALALIYMRKKSRWRDGDRIQPVNLPADDPLRKRFSEAILKLRPAALEDYWNEQYFHGILPPHVVQSELAMARFISSTTSPFGDSYTQYPAAISAMKRQPSSPAADVAAETSGDAVAGTCDIGTEAAGRMTAAGCGDLAIVGIGGGSTIAWRTSTNFGTAGSTFASVLPRSASSNAVITNERTVGS
jgi:hypothetical protein